MMTIERLKVGELGKSGYMLERGIPKVWESNWITLFMMNNPAKNLADVVKMPKFKMMSEHYHYIIIELKNGCKKALLFCDGKCVYSSWSQLEDVEVEEVAE